MSSWYPTQSRPQGATINFRKNNFAILHFMNLLNQLKKFLNFKEYFHTPPMDRK